MELDSAVIRETEPYLLRIAQRAVGNATLARDLVQEAFAAAVDPRTVHDATRGTLRGFLSGILMRKVADHFRKHGRERWSSEFDETLDSPRDFAPFDPERRLHPIDRSRAMTVVEAALYDLPEAQRLAVIACDIEQLERGEAAESLGITEGNLRVLLHRGRHRLRKALEDARMR